MKTSTTRGFSSPMFVDTNVLVNSRAAGAPHHEIARELLTTARQRAEPLRISRQVVREYLAVVTRPQIWSGPLTSNEALYDVNWLLNDFEILEDGIAATGLWSPTNSQTHCKKQGRMIIRPCREIDTCGVSRSSGSPRPRSPDLRRARAGRGDPGSRWDAG